MTATTATATQPRDMYRYLVHAWREGDTRPLPIASNTEPEGRAMFEHVLRDGSGFDHAELSERVGTSAEFRVLETRHRTGS